MIKMIDFDDDDLHYSDQTEVPMWPGGDSPCFNCGTAVKSCSRTLLARTVFGYTLLARTWKSSLLPTFIMIIIIRAVSVVIIVALIIFVTITTEKNDFCIKTFGLLISLIIINFSGRWFVLMIMASLVLLGVLTLLTVGVTLNI